MVEFERRTLVAEARFAGPGLHSGAPCEAVVGPGQDGLWLTAEGRRTEVEPGAVADTLRCTRLGSVSTVEHLLAALAGLGVTDAEIHVSGGEVPAADGSALPFAAAIEAAGTVACGVAAAHGLFERVFSTDGRATVAISRGEGHWRYEFDAGERWPGASAFGAELTPGVFLSEVAPARTFAFEEEVERLRAAGLGRGLDESSCLVLGRSGYVNPARFSDEPARHKLLDLVGDLSLAGVPTAVLNVVAARSGHTLNVQAAGRLASRVRVER